MKAKIDKKLCKHCGFGDKDNMINGNAVCLSKMYNGNCKFDR